MRRAMVRVEQERREETKRQRRAPTKVALKVTHYDVQAGHTVAASGGYRSKLRIRRVTDGRVIYPFEDCTVPSAYGSAWV